VEVELSRELLTDAPTEMLLIMALCALGMVARHRVVPDDRSLWNPWVNKLPPALAEEVRYAWDEGERRIAEGGESERIVVRPSSPNFRQTPIQLPPIEALSLLGRPLQVVLENGRNDRAFLLAFADRATREAIVYAEDAGWLAFEMGGGIGEIALRIESALGAKDDQIFRTMYLSDSDAREAGALSDEASRVQASLATLGATFARYPSHFGRVLARRAAENYAPPSAVLTWARDAAGLDAWRLIAEAKSPAERARLAIGAGTAGSARRRLLAAVALGELPTHLRGFIDMKHGREREDAIRTDDAVWNALDEYQKAALRDGFGGSFSVEFYGSQTELSDETKEISGFLGKILERL